MQLGDSLVLTSLLILSMVPLGAAETEPVEKPDPTRLKLTVLFDSESHREGLETDWGYALLIEGLEKTILFDTGADGEILLANMGKLGIDPGIVDTVFLSHNHGDHTRGLGPFLAKNADVEVWMPAYFPESLQESVRSAGARLRIVEEPRPLFAGAYSTGEMGRGLIEQSLVLDTAEGLTVVTGCAHPGIVEIVRKAKELWNKPVHLIVGGFHLRSTEGEELAAVIDSLRKDGVKAVAPCHCTGDEATDLFRKTWADDFTEARCGAVFEIR